MKFYIIIIINAYEIPTILNSENPSHSQSNRLRFFPVTLNVSYSFAKLLAVKSSPCVLRNVFQM